MVEVEHFYVSAFACDPSSAGKYWKAFNPIVLNHQPIYFSKFVCPTYMYYQFYLCLIYMKPILSGIACLYLVTDLIFEEKQIVLL